MSELLSIAAIVLNVPLLISNIAWTIRHRRQRKAPR